MLAVLDKTIKLPRLYVDCDLRAGEPAALGPQALHYLRNVMRRKAGDRVRLFNGRDGEWLCVLEDAGGKRVSVVPESCLRSQPPPPRPLHLAFAPVKKARLDWLVEKAVELGATALHPVLTRNAEVRVLNEARLTAQMAEAAEQCERMDLPALTPLIPLPAFLSDFTLKDFTGTGAPLLACLERAPDAAPLSAALPPPPDSAAFLIGPEGGFTEDERRLILAAPGVRPVSLGPRILRSETAVCAALAACLLQGEG